MPFTGRHPAAALPLLPWPPRPRPSARGWSEVRTGLLWRLRSARAAGLALTALLAGSATYLLQDAFTHPRRWGTAHLAVLRASWHGVPGWMSAQDLSILIGGAVLMGWLARWWWRTPPAPQPARGRRRGAWPWATLAAIGLSVGAGAWPGQPDPRAAAVAAALRGGGAIAVGAAVLAVGWHASPRSRRAAADGSPGAGTG